MNRLPDSSKDVVQYMLALENNRQPIKEADLKKRVELGKTNYVSQMAEISSCVKDVLGCSIVSHENRIMVKNNLPDMKTEVQQSDDLEEDAKKGLLIIVLTSIFMASNPACPKPISENFIYRVLEDFGIVVMVPDLVFGDIKKLIAPANNSEFVHQGWLSFTKVSTPDHGTEFFFEWGPRALACINPVELLEVFCRMMGDPEPKSWTGHYTKAQEMLEDMKKYRLKILNN